MNSVMKTLLTTVACCSCVLAELKQGLYSNVKYAAKAAVTSGSPCLPGCLTPAGMHRYPRTVLKRGMLHKRGRSGVFFERFVVRPAADPDLAPV